MIAIYMIDTIFTIFTIAVMALCFKLGMNAHKRSSNGESSIKVIEGIFTDAFVVIYEVIRFIVIKIRELFENKSDKYDKSDKLDKDNKDVYLDD